MPKAPTHNGILYARVSGLLDFSGSLFRRARARARARARSMVRARVRTRARVRVRVRVRARVGVRVRVGVGVRPTSHVPLQPAGVSPLLAQERLAATARRQVGRPLGCRGR